MTAIHHDIDSNCYFFFRIILTQQLRADGLFIRWRLIICYGSRWFTLPPIANSGQCFRTRVYPFPISGPVVSLSRGKKKRVLRKRVVMQGDPACGKVVRRNKESGSLMIRGVSFQLDGEISFVSGENPPPMPGLNPCKWPLQPPRDFRIKNYFYAWAQQPPRAGFPSTLLPPSKNDATLAHALFQPPRKLLSNCDPSRHFP